MRQGVERPPCPRGHTGRVHLDAYTKNRYGTNERARYRCLPDVGPSHTFMPPMRHRHSTAAGAHECDSCERELRRVDGPSVGVKFEFTVREAAFALVRLGQGETYRGVGEEVRERAGKPIRPNSKMCKRGRTVSNEANTPLNYTDTLADVVIEELREQAWPPILIVDALPFRAHKTPEEKAAARLLYPEFEQEAAASSETVRRAQGYGRAWTDPRRDGDGQAQQRATATRALPLHGRRR